MTAVTERPGTEIGKRRTRKEDQHLITGRSTFVDNMTLPGMVYLAILRSPMAHAVITSIDASPARERPGVIAAFTGRDFADSQGDLPCAWPVTPDMVNPGYPSLAVTQVNFAGDAVAVVAARTRAQAVDALEAIEVDYDPLPAVTDLEAALADGAPLVHQNTTSNKSYTWSLESGAAGTGGSITDALAAAEVTVSRRLVQQRISPSFMEPRSTVVQPNGDGITIWSDPDPAHPAYPAGADAWYPRAEGACDRPGRGRRLRREDPDHA